MGATSFVNVTGGVRAAPAGSWLRAAPRWEGVPASAISATARATRASEKTEWKTECIPRSGLPIIMPPRAGLPIREFDRGPFSDHPSQLSTRHAGGLRDTLRDLAAGDACGAYERPPAVTIRGGRGERRRMPGLI